MYSTTTYSKSAAAPAVVLLCWPGKEVRTFGGCDRLGSDVGRWGTGTGGREVGLPVLDGVSEWDSDSFQDGSCTGPRRFRGLARPWPEVRVADAAAIRLDVEKCAIRCDFGGCNLTRPQIGQRGASCSRRVIEVFMGSGVPGSGGPWLRDALPGGLRCLGTCRPEK